MVYWRIRGEAEQPCAKTMQSSGWQFPQISEKGKTGQYVSVLVCCVCAGLSLMRAQRGLSIFQIFLFFIYFFFVGEKTSTWMV